MSIRATGNASNTGVTETPGTGRTEGGFGNARTSRVSGTTGNSRAVGGTNAAGAFDTACDNRTVVGGVGGSARAGNLTTAAALKPCARAAEASWAFQ